MVMSPAGVVVAAVAAAAAVEENAAMVARTCGLRNARACRAMVTILIRSGRSGGATVPAPAA